MRYRGYGLPIADIISEGNVGLMQAVKRFEPERGFRLATYAMWWIKASIQEYILRSWSLGRAVTAASAKRFAENLMPIIREIRAAGAAGQAAGCVGRCAALPARIPPNAPAPLPRSRAPLRFIYIDQKDDFEIFLR